jgi:hypothetical protein
MQKQKESEIYVIQILPQTSEIDVFHDTKLHKQQNQMDSFEISAESTRIENSKEQTGIDGILSKDEIIIREFLHSKSKVFDIPRDFDKMSDDSSFIQDENEIYYSNSLLSSAFDSSNIVCKNNLSQFDLY